jgi:hypothetical protein
MGPIMRMGGAEPGHTYWTLEDRFHRMPLIALFCHDAVGPGRIGHTSAASGVEGGRPLRRPWHPHPIADRHLSQQFSLWHFDRILASNFR